MPLSKLATLTSWSYSVYTQYMKCPLSVCFDKIKRIRIVEPPNIHFEKGNRVHEGAEKYIGMEDKKLAAYLKELKKKLPPMLDGKTKIPRVPTYELLKAVEPRLEIFRKAKAKAELEWAFTKDYQPTSWTNWAGAWLRIKVDVCHEQKAPPLVHIVDWKTGRAYEEHKQQRSLYALGGLQLVDLGLLADGNKDVKVIAEHLYTDTTQSATEEFTMKDLKPLKREWGSRIKQMMTDTRYPAKTGYHCRYCKFRKSAGGPCSEDQ